MILFGNNVNQVVVSDGTEYSQCNRNFFTTKVKYSSVNGQAFKDLLGYEDQDNLGIIRYTRDAERRGSLHGIGKIFDSIRNIMDEINRRAKSIDSTKFKW